jgi:hypothetical protein
MGALSDWPVQSGDIADDDLLASTDVSDTSGSSEGTSKSLTLAKLRSYLEGFYVKVSALTGAASLPVGTVAQRPETPAAGMFRFNSTDGTFEGHNGTEWGPIAGGGGLDWSEAAKTSDFTAEAGKGYNADNSSRANAMTLPLNPEAGDSVAVKDYAGSFGDFNLTVDGNGKKIEGLSEDMVVDTDGWAGTFVFTGDTKGWVLVTSTPMTTIETKPLMHVQHVEDASANVAAVVGWNDRDLNTVRTNQIAGASLSAGEITLPAGTYFLDGIGVCMRINRYHSAIRKDDDTVLLQGVVGYNAANTTYGEAAMSPVSGVLTLGAATTIKLSTYTQAAYGYGLGLGGSGAGLDEVFADLRIWQLDGTIEKPRVFQPVNQPITGAYTTGNIFGGELVYVDADTVQVKAFSCFDDGLTTELVKNSTTNIDPAGGSMAINTVYNIFAVKLTSDGSITVKDDTDVNGANLTGITAKRWLGFVKTDSSGNICVFQQTDDLVTFGDRDQMVFFNSWVDTGFNQIDHSSFLPISRIREIGYGYYRNSGSGSKYACDTSLDGTNHESFISYCYTAYTRASTSIDAWGESTDAQGGMLPFTNSRYFRSGASTGSFSLLVKALRIKR